MNRLLSLLMALILLTLPALADIPPGLWGESLTDDELLPLMYAAMARELPGAVICQDASGAPLAVYDFGSGFCAARRDDGLITLCCFSARGEELRLDWHNDLLLSFSQELSFSAKGPAWRGDGLIALSLRDDMVTLLLPLQDGCQLMLLGEYDPAGWHVTEMTVLLLAGGIGTPVLTLQESALAEDILLEFCHPQDWHFHGDSAF